MNSSLCGLVHTQERFTFIADTTVEAAWPLFGAEKERAWAPGWDPAFIWPAIANDQQGMVFRIAHGGKSAVWVNTRLDALEHRAQYVYFIPEVVATIIDLKLTPSGPSTRVDVIYQRTALTPSANATVSNMAAADRVAGAEWEQQINSYLHEC
jgi:hypothetical protein